MLLLGPHDLVGRGLAYCLGHGGAGDTVLGGGDPVRQALAGHLCGPSASPPARQPAGNWHPQAPEGPRRPPPPPHPLNPAPAPLLLRLPARGGAQGRAPPPGPERAGSGPPRGQARRRLLRRPPPQFRFLSRQNRKLYWFGVCSRAAPGEQLFADMGCGGQGSSGHLTSASPASSGTQRPLL